MASILKVDDLRGNTAAGNITITSEGGSATMQLQQGVAKAWSTLDGDNSTPAFFDSFNFASITDNATGDFTQTYTSAMNNGTYNYSTFGHAESTGPQARTCNVYDGYPLTTAFRARYGYPSNTGGGSTAIDDKQVVLSIHGDLA